MEDDQELKEFRQFMSECGFSEEHLLKTVTNEQLETPDYETLETIDMPEWTMTAFMYLIPFSLIFRFFSYQLNVSVQTFLIMVAFAFILGFCLNILRKLHMFYYNKDIGDSKLTHLFKFFLTTPPHQK